jgi:hypothetical protein
LHQVGIVDECGFSARLFNFDALEELMERMMMKQMTRGFPVVLLAAWMAMAVLTLNSFIGFSAVMHH